MFEVKATIAEALRAPVKFKIKLRKYI